MNDQQIYELSKNLEEGQQIFWIPDHSNAREVRTIGPPPPEGPEGSEEEVQEPSECAYFHGGGYVALWNAEFEEFKVTTPPDSTDGWIDISLNDTVRFRVTNPESSPVKPNDLGFVELTLWEFAQIYGPSLYHGNPQQPVECKALLKRSYSATPTERYYHIVGYHTGEVIGVCTNAGARDALREDKCTLVEISKEVFDAFGDDNDL